MHKGQGALEYIMLIAGIAILSLIALIILQGNITSSSKQATTQTATYLEFTTCLAQNLVPNPSFESDANNDAIPDNWAKTNSPAYDSSRTHAYAGNAAINITATDNYASPSIPISPLKEYALIAYLKRDPTSTGQSAITIEQYAGTVLQSSETQTLSANPQQNYQAYKLSFTSCPTCDNAIITAKALDNNKITADNICLSPAP